MGKKRRSSGAEEEGELEPKKLKATEVEFTGTHFKSLLKDPSSALNGLAKFVTLSKKLPSPNLYDVVEGYIKISVECIEILKLLDGERRPESENMIIFQALEAILLRTASDLSHLNIAGVNIVKNMLNTHMKIIYTCLYSETHRMSRICLNLLSAMVTQGPECARDVFSHFDFNNKFLPGLLKRRDKQGRPDVRMAYIQFALSFLISGDNTLIVQLLELKDFFGEIFSNGIKEDRISTLNLLLSLLETKVVHNKAITKTQKVRLFTPVILNHIASLYRWSGIVDVSTKNVTDIKDPKEAGKVMIRELVHSFLVDICCSLKHGINFYDPSLGTAGRAGNLVLLRFLVGLKSATEDEMISDLVVSILKVCPDLLTRYFKETQYSFVPRLKSAWLDNIKLLKKIYDALPEISPAFRTQEFIPIPRLLTMVMVTTIAPVCNKALFTQGLNLPNKIVKHTILSLVASILRRAERNIDHCLREDVWQKSEIYTPAMMAEFSQKYREALSKLLPDMNIIVATWQSLLKQESAVADSENGEKVPTAEEKETELAFQEVLEKKDELHVSDDVQTTLLKATLLQVLCLYQRVVPHLVAQSTFDFGKLLKGIVSEKGIREEVPPVLQYQILQVALELPANKFAWFKVQEVSEGGEKSIFYLLLKMFATCNKAQLKSSTRLLIIKVLRDSGVFEYTWKELDLWLRNLDKIADNSKNTVIQFLERTLLRLVSNPYPYTDKAAEIVQEASLLQLSSGKQDSETVSIPVSHIDDVLDMVDVIVEGSEGLDDEVGMALDEDLILQTFPFSAVVPVALEFRNSMLTQTKDEDADNVVQYLVSVLTDVLHSQRDPLALCLMLQCYDKEIKVVNRNSVQYIQLGQFNDYYSLWIPASAKETLFTECDDSMIEKCQRDESYSSLLKKTYASRDISKSDTVDVLNNAVLKLTLDELPLAVKHSLLCLKSTVDNFSKFKKGTGASLITLYLNLLHSLLCRFDLAKAEPHEKTAESQEESELFIDANYISSIDTPDNKILEDLLAVIFKHPTLEGWFLALGRQSLPPHTLNPIGVKVLSSHVNKGVIQLLSFSAPLLQQNSNLHLISKYFSAIAESILKELEDKKALNKMSQPVEALQSLHPYLDTAQLNEITLAILRLPEDHLFVMKSPNHSSMDKQLSCYGKVLVQLLTESHRRKHQLEADLVSSVEHVKGVGSLLSPSSGGEMEAVLYEALQKDPVFSLVIGVHTLKYCLEQMTETCLSIAALLIEHSRTHLLQFELWCTKSGIQKSLRKNMEAFLPLINVYLMCRSRFQFTRPSQVSSAALCVLKEAMWCKLVNVALSSEKSSEHVLVLSSIIRESDVSDEELQNLFDQLPVALAQSWNPDKWALADAVSQSADRSGKDMSFWKQALLASCMKCLIATYSANKESEASTQEAEKALLLHLKELMPFVKKNIPTEWKTLVKSGLKYRYKDCEFLAALREGIELWYGSESLSVKGLVELPVIHMMITQHSLFLPTLLRSREEQNENNTSREMLVDLLRSVVMKCPSVCDGNHFAVLLGAYGASLSRTDQKILLLLQAYEKNNISLTDFRLLLWGPAAVEHHKTRKSLGKSLWQQPSMEEILTLLDRERMMKTILHFPQHRKLVTEQDRVFEDSAITDLDDLYDPCFLLPLFSELIRPELVVDCLKFVDVNGLGLAVAALSSYDYNMRAAAYYILGTFLSHMEGARFRDKKQLQNLMDVVKNGIRQQNLRLTFSLTLYVAKAAQQILKPEEHMYIKICRFLLSHQYLDMKKVPDFYKLFYSFDLEHKLEREWILGLLNDGMRDRYCYELYDYQRIFHVLLTFYNSPLCDETSQNQILEVLQNAALVTKAAYQLIRDQSLLTWILNILERRYLANKMLANVILLVHNLWLTNLGNKESDCSDEEQSKEGSTNKKKFLPLHFVNEFFSVLMALLRHIRSNLQFIQLKQFFSTMSSVLSHRKVVLKAFKEMGRFAVNEKIFSAKDALVFLHKWSTIEKDTKLQERLSNLAQKYKVKELLDIIKEKYRPHDSRQLKKRKELEDQEDSEEQQEVISHLEDSRDHIKSILMHWEPVFSNTAFVAKKENADREGKLQTEDCNKDESSDTDQFVSATACLVANWILKTESEHAMNTQNIYKSIKWFNASIVPHTHVMQEIIKDSVLKNTIFRLFSRACSVTEKKVSSLELMRLFNTVMIRLIETQMLGKNAWHDAVKAICPDSSPDSARTAPGEFLVSLYVGDFWLGAEETGMLRSHVEVINEAAQMDFTGSKQKKPTRKKREYEEGIVSLCKDLLRRFTYPE